MTVRTCLPRVYGVMWWSPIGRAGGRYERASDLCRVAEMRGLGKKRAVWSGLTRGRVLGCM